MIDVVMWHRSPIWLSIAIGLVAGAVMGGLGGFSAWAAGAVAGLIAAIAVITVLPLRPIVWLYVIVLATPLTAAMPRGALVPFLGLNDVLVVFVMALTVLYAAMSQRALALPPVILAAVIAFVLGTVVVPWIAYVARGVDLDSAAVSSLLAPLKFLLLLFLCAIVPASREERSRVVYLMALSAGVVAVIGLLQAAGIGPVVDAIRMWYPSGQVERAAEAGRVTSVLGAWNSLGIFLVTVILIIAATINDEASTRRRKGMVASAMLAIVCLIATNLYSGLLGVVLGFVMLKSVDGRGLRWLVPIAVVGVIGFVVLLPSVTDRAAAQFTGESWVPQTLRFRYDVWMTHFVPAIVEQPWWGVYPTFEGIAFPFPESQYIALMYRSGAVSLAGHVLWLALVIVWLAHVRRRLRSDPEARWDRSLALVPIVLLLVLSLIGVINPVFTYTASMSYLWMLLGLIMNAGREYSDARS